MEGTRLRRTSRTIRIRLRKNTVVMEGAELYERYRFPTEEEASAAMDRALAGAKTMLAEGRIEGLDVHGRYRRVG